MDGLAITGLAVGDYTASANEMEALYEISEEGGLYPFKAEFLGYDPEANLYHFRLFQAWEDLPE